MRGLHAVYAGNMERTNSNLNPKKSIHKLFSSEIEIELIEKHICNAPPNYHMYLCLYLNKRRLMQFPPQKKKTKTKAAFPLQEELM